MGINISQFKKRKISKPIKYHNSKILLFVGRLSEQKGVQYLIGAMPEIVNQFRNARLLIIGDGPFRDNLEEISQDKKLENNIDFLGPMDSGEIAKFYNYSDIFILPSISHSSGTEALGLSLLEAMSSGCPVIGSDAGGIPFIITHNKNGIIVPQKNPKELARSILSLIKDKKKLRKLSTQAEIFSRNNFSWKKISKKFLKIYGRLIK